MNIISLKSSNYSKKARKIKTIKHLVIHYTGMQSIRASLSRLLSKKHKVSCHYLIDRKGKIFKMVDENKIAWHAGKSKWRKFKNLNKSSIGIELENKGHEFWYQKFSTKQINVLINLCLLLKKKYQIKDCNILGHSDIAPLRKLDPGEKFPWFKLKNKRLGIWCSSNRMKTVRKSLSEKNTRNIFFANLYKIGYRYFSLKKTSKLDRKIIIAFQRRFRQNNVNGLIDTETLKISDYLIKNT